MLLAIDRFSFTANNITYAALGDAFKYWNFFPAEHPWGQIPVWGFADVAASRHPEITEGTRVYGYLPMARQLKVEPGRVSKSGFTDSPRTALTCRASTTSTCSPPTTPPTGRNMKPSRCCCARCWSPPSCWMTSWQGRMTINDLQGADNVARAYEDTLEGRVSPEQGLILTLAP